MYVHTHVYIYDYWDENFKLNNKSHFNPYLNIIAP